MAEPIGPDTAPGRAAAHVMYALYAIALFTAVPFFAGVIVAYLGRSGSGEIFRSHLTWGIRTFWWALFWFVIGAILSLILVGYVILAILWLWTAYRVIRGWLRLADGLSIA